MKDNKHKAEINALENRKYNWQIYALLSYIKLWQS